MTLLELKSMLSLNNIEVDDDSLRLLEKYMFYILEKNEHINLTAIKDVDSYMSLMIFDSALPLRLLDFNDKKVLDIGTGAGYPGTVLATLSTAHVDLLDSTKKKLDVIKNYPDQDFNVINIRAEDYAQSHREEYDVVVARAVSDLPIILELGIPFLKVGGYLVAMKGKDAEEEIKRSKNALKKLNAIIEKMDKVILPTGETRINILIKKLDKTNEKYPRNYNIIKNKPL